MKKPNLGSYNASGASSYETYYAESYAEPNRPLYTGRYLMTLPESQNRADEILSEQEGMRVAHSADFSRVAHEEDLTEADAYVFDDLNIALVSGESDRINRLSAKATGCLVEPEKVVYLPDDVPVISANRNTWGIRAIGANESPYSGVGIKVAVLDTGMDLKHPDFSNRSIVSESFVPGETAEDKNGHGTHCVGTACGAKDREGKRYGVAYESDIYIGKVLSNRGSGAQFWVLSAIDWALKEGCQVISMSLGSRVYPGQGYDPAYERVGKFALKKGSVLLAAAGNESRRSRGIFQPVGSPANCPSILAVGAVDENMGLGDFSNRSINPGGQIDVVGPGVDVYSSWPMPERNRSISGTSMATPHVAGILAMLREKHPDQTPYFLLNELKNQARRLDLPSIDAGVGLALAPKEEVF